MNLNQEEIVPGTEFKSYMCSWRFFVKPVAFMLFILFFIYISWVLFSQNKITQPYVKIVWAFFILLAIYQIKLKK
jgi:hypothetical protein